MQSRRDGMPPLVGLVPCTGWSPVRAPTLTTVMASAAKERRRRGERPSSQGQPRPRGRASQARRARAPAARRPPGAVRLQSGAPVGTGTRDRAPARGGGTRGCSEGFLQRDLGGIQLRLATLIEDLLRVRVCTHTHTCGGMCTCGVYLCCGLCVQVCGVHMLRLWGSEQLGPGSDSCVAAHSWQEHRSRVLV